MKRFIKRICFFSLSIVIPLILVEFFLRQVPNPYKYKYDWMQENAKDVEIIILGSSHSFYGIRPEYLNGKAFSLANVSQDIDHDLFLLEYWGTQYSKLKTVVFPISYFSWFDKGLQYGSDAFRCRYYKIYMDSNDYPFLSIKNFELSDIRTAKIKMKKLFQHEKNPGYDKYGWGTMFALSGKDMTQWDDDSEAEAAIFRHKAKGWDNIESNYSKLSQLASFCTQHNAKLIFITTPCWSSYTDRLDAEQRSKMYELTCHFTKEFNIPYFDYLKDSRFEANDFYDSNHLSDVGAIKFTRILNQDIESLEE